MPPGEDLYKTVETNSKRYSLWRVIAELVIAALIFGGGIAVGKGNVNLFQHKIVNPNANLSDKLDYSSVDKVYSLLKANFDGQLDNTKLSNGLKAGLVEASGDPYTEYFDPQAAKDFESALSGNFTGIGAQLGADENGNIIIVSPLSGYPAEKAGLRPKDIILKIDKKVTQGMNIDTVVHKIRGEAGTKVTLTILRGTNQFDVTITRAVINIPSVEYKEEGDFGYLKVSQFSEDTIDLSQKAAAEFKAKNVKGVVLDLRGDPGGFVSSAVGLTSLWLDKGQKIVEERRGSVVDSVETATGGNLLKGLPTVVLIDEGSASASEITAGALHDSQVATLVGVKSFGKGSVQKVEKLADGSEVKITIARWYTPKGQNIDKQGITPDVVIARSEADQKASKDPQKDKAYEILKTKSQ